MKRILVALLFLWPLIGLAQKGSLCYTGGFVYKNSGIDKRDGKLYDATQRCGELHAFLRDKKGAPQLVYIIYEYGPPKYKFSLGKGPRKERRTLILRVRDKEIEWYEIRELYVTAMLKYIKAKKNQDRPL